ncbi:MAG: CAP domain-containing protein [Sulfitobacter sp.]|nr:CAP domain-containing protein [Sulfitobacter sp.]
MSLMVAALPALASPDASSWLNGFRSNGGRGALVWSDRLALAAQIHASDMAEQGYFSHTGRNGASVGDRARGVGYNWCLVAENIAKGQVSLTEVMRDWAESPGHRKNMLNGQVTEFGMAWATGDVWVMVLARRC